MFEGTHTRDLWHRLRSNSLWTLEAVALLATLAAYALTVLSVRAGTGVEANPVARWAIAEFGWVFAGVFALGVVHSVFAVYRALEDSYVRATHAGAIGVVVFSSLDCAVAAWRYTQLETWALWGPFAESLATVLLVGAGLLAWVGLRASRVRLSRAVPEKRPRVAAALVLALVVVGVGGGLVATGTQPVAAEGVLIDGFEDGDLSDGSDGWVFGAGDTGSAVTDVVYEGDYAADIDGPRNENIDPQDTFAVWIYDRRGTNDALLLEDSAATDTFVNSRVDTSGNFEYFDGSSWQSTSITVPSKEWVLLRYSSLGSGGWDITVYDADNTTIGSATGLSTDSGWGSIGTVKIVIGDGTYDNFQEDRSLSDFTFKDEVFSRSVSGTVTDGAGAGLGDATVTYDNGSEFTATTDGDGDYSLDLVDDTYDVTVERAGFETLETTVTVSGDTTKDFELSGAQQIDYTMQVCYRGAAEFDAGSAGALWTKIPTGQQGGEDALSVQHPEDYDAEITEFDSTHNTTNDVTVTDDWYYETQIATRNTAFRFAGHGISAGDRFNQFTISVPFGDRAGIDNTDGDECAVPGADESETPTPTDGAVTDTATPDTDTPRPSEATATASPTPIPEAREIDGPTAVGTCSLPAQDGGTKSGLLLEYYDPNGTTEQLDYSLEYNGTTYSDTIDFAQPKGYYYGCHGGGSGGLGDGTGGPPALNQTIEELLEPLNTSTNGLENLTVTYPNGTNETANLSESALLNETGLNATQEWRNATLGYLNGTQQVLENITQLPYWNQSGPGWTEPIANVTAGYENGTESTWNQTGFNSTDPLNSVDGINASDPLSAGGGGGGGGLFAGGGGGDGGGGGLPIIALSGVAFVGVAAYRRYAGGGGGGGSGIQLRGGG